MADLKNSQFRIPPQMQQLGQTIENLNSNTKFNRVNCLKLICSDGGLAQNALFSIDHFIVVC